VELLHGGVCGAVSNTPLITIVEGLWDLGEIAHFNKPAFLLMDIQKANRTAFNCRP